MRQFRKFHASIMGQIASLIKYLTFGHGLGKAALLAVLVSLAACNNADFIRPQLLSTPVLVGSNEFGVIKVTYAKGFAETNLDSLVLTIHRGGDLVSIIKRSAAQEKLDGVLDYWYQVRSGDQTSWVFGAWLDQYPLEMQAQTASLIIRDREFPTAAQSAKK